MSERLEILLIEDSEGDIELARVACRRSAVDNQVHVTRTVEHALRFLRQEAPYADAPRPGLVFLDLNLPGRKGTDVLETMANDESLADIPIVVLTGSDAPDDIEASYRLKASCYLTKPVDLTVLLEVVSSVEGFFEQLQST
ncbi:MAG: response regulator [Sandaracinaceae bacterium]